MLLSGDNLKSHFRVKKKRPRDSVRTLKNTPHKMIWPFLVGARCSVHEEKLTTEHVFVLHFPSLGTPKSYLVSHSFVVGPHALLDDAELPGAQLLQQGQGLGRDDVLARYLHVGQRGISNRVKEKKRVK